MQQPAFDIVEVYRRQVGTVYRLCYARLGNAADAEDATQSVFTKLIEHAPVFNDHEHEKAWLIRCAINHCNDVFKSAAKSKSTELPDNLAEPSDEAASAREVLDAVLALPDPYKDCVYLHYYEGYKTDEIALMTDANPSTVRNRLADARKLLKNALEA